MSKHMMIPLIAATTLLLAACGQGFTTESSRELPGKTVYTPSKPVVKKVGSHTVVEGAVTHTVMNIGYDTVTRYMAIKGKIQVNDVDSGVIYPAEIEMQGTRVEGADTIVLKNTGKGATLPHGMEVGAKATCMGDDLDCTTAFVDIFVQFKGKYYRLQVETREPEMDPFKEAQEKDALKQNSPKKDEPKKSEPAQPQQPKQDSPKADQPKTETPKVDQPKADSSQADADHDEEEHEGDEDKDAVKGNYQGDIEGDIDELFPQDGKVVPPKKQSDKDPSVTPNLQNWGSTSNGRLAKPANLLEYSKTRDSLGLFVLRPERNRHYATNELMAVLLEMGRFSQKIAPNHKLAIGDISAPKGGKLSGHASHQMGVDVDVVYYFKDVTKPKLFLHAIANGQKRAKAASIDPDFMVEEQWKLLKHTVSLQWTDRIFVHPKIKAAFCQLAEKNGELKNDTNPFGASETLRRLRPEFNHGDHFHLRTLMRCNKEDRRCQPMAPPAAGTGCDKIQLT
jgi:Murein endopeptidase